MTVPFHFATCAWGGHVDLMLKVLLPSLLAPGNLPALGDGAHRLTVYTSAEVAPRITRALSDVDVRLPVAAYVVPVTIDTTGPRGIYGPSTEGYIDALRTAHAHDATFVCVPPDAVFSDGLVATLQAKANEGVRCVHTCGLRLDMDKALDLLAIGRGLSGLLAPSPRDMVALACSALHHSNSVHLWDNAGSDFLPSNLLWPVEGGGGVIVRSFHSYPVMIRPTTMPETFGVTLDQDFALRSVPDLGQHVMLTDSDAGCAFELSPADKRLGHQATRSVEGVRAWAAGSANALHRWTAARSFWLHAGDVDRTVAGMPWRVTEDRVAAIMGEILA